MARYDARQIVDNIERVIEEERALLQGGDEEGRAGRLREARTRERDRSLLRTMEKESFRKMREFQDVDRVPPGSRFKAVKSIWARFLRLVSARQAAYNYNNLSALQQLASQLDLVQTRLHAIEDGDSRPAGMSMLQGSEATRLSALVTHHLHGLHQNVDYMSRNMTQVAGSLAQLLDNISGLSQRLGQLNLRQGDFFGEISAARRDTTRIWSELGLIYESIDNRAEDIWKGLDERDIQLQLNTEASQKLHGQTSTLEASSRELKARLLVLSEQLTIHQEMLEELSGRLAAEAPVPRAHAATEAPASTSQPTAEAVPAPAPAAARASHFLGEGSSANTLVQKQLDLAYLRFQRQFRADEEDLKARQKDYIVLLRNHLQLEQSSTPQILDVACGDGVFLELVREEGWKGRGVDINEAMVKMGAGKGLAIDCDDAIGWLERQEPKSYDAISAFQFVEHLPPFVLLKMLKASYTALKPGGLLLIETINPHTLKALHWFHLDLSHERLVFPEMMQLLAETAGFHFEEWKGINRVSEDDRLREEGDGVRQENIRKLNDFLFGDQDYYLLARRPGGAAR